MLFCIKINNLYYEFIYNINYCVDTNRAKRRSLYKYLGLHR